MHYYQFHIGDYKKDTGHLSLLEHGIYRSLIDSYFENEGELCADDAKLMRSHCVRTPEEKEAYFNVINDFFIKQGDSYFHEGCDARLQRLFDKSAKAKASAEARWAKKNAKKCESNANAPTNNANALKRYANAMRSECEVNANEMLPNNPLPINPVTHKPNTLNSNSNLIKKDARGASSKKFKKPTVDEISNYLSERGQADYQEAESIHDFYESKGWKVGSSPMKDWKAAVRNWMKRKNQKGFSNQPKNQKSKADRIIDGLAAWAMEDDNEIKTH